MSGPSLQSLREKRQAEHDLRRAAAGLNARVEAGRDPSATTGARGCRSRTRRACVIVGRSGVLSVEL